MESKLILLIIMLTISAIILTVGVLCKKYTKRRLNDIDGFDGVYKTGNRPGKIVSIFGEIGKNKTMTENKDNEKQ